MLLLVTMVIASTTMKQVSPNKHELEMFVSNECVHLDNDLITTNVSFHGCLKQCKERGNCATMNYNQKVSLCRINFKEEATEECQGYIHSRKSNWNMRDFNACDCPPGNLCDKQGDCSPSECSKLEQPDNGQMFGTRFSIGAKVSFKCKPGYILDGTRSRVCLRGGTWTGQDASCPEDPNCNHSLVSEIEGGTSNTQILTRHWCRSLNCKARLRSEKIISGIATKLRAHWLRKEMNTFYIQYSTDCLSFTTVINKTGVEMIFDGNMTPGDVIIHDLPQRIKAKCVRLEFRYRNYYFWNSYLFEVLGC